MSEVSALFQANAKIWQSGDWQMALREDEFADIKFQGIVVLRSIRALIRDQNWNTADMVIDAFSESAERLAFKVHSAGFGAKFDGTVSVLVNGNSASFHLDLTTQTDFQTNRTGLVVLHSPTNAGANLSVTHSNGSVEESKFPRQISPNQPVFDIAGLAWHCAGLDVSMAFAGDVFEMEDQRNWSDASYKTYNRPLSLPFPYLLGAGERVVQTISLNVAATGSAAAHIAPNKIELKAAGKFAQIQVGASTAPDTGVVIEASASGSLPVAASALLVELDLQSSNWQAALARAAASGLPLDVRAIVGDLTELADLVGALDGVNVIRIAAFDATLHVSTGNTTAALRMALAGHGKKIQVVSGARSHFTELNREQALILQDAEEIFFSTTPMFHARGTEQLLESVAMQRIIARQAVQIAGGKPVHIGPITLRPRFNNVATAAEPGPSKSDLSEGYGAEFTGSIDARQTSPELGAWVIASAAALSVPAVASLTWFEQWGPRGLGDANGKPYPAASAVNALADLQGQELFIGDSPDGFIWAMAAKTGNQITVLVSNLHRELSTVEINVEGVIHQVALAPLSWQVIS
jgi:hypothetical protein